MKVACPLCKKENISLFTKTTDPQNKNNPTEYIAYECLCCSIVFQHPFPSQADYNNMYLDDYYAHSTANNIPFLLKKLSLILQGKRTIFNCIKNVIFPYFSYIKDANTILDIGCGKGVFLDILKKEGKITYGLEPDEKAVINLRKNGHFATLGNIADSNFNSSFFDLVTMYQVIEHIDNPTLVLNEVHRILKPEGALIIETPNISSSLSKNKNHWVNLDLPRHVILYDAKSLVALLRKAGFHSEVYIRVSPSDIRHTFFLKHNIQNRYLKKLTSICLLPYIVFQYICKMSQGSLLIIIAKKLKH